MSDQDHFWRDAALVGAAAYVYSQHQAQQRAQEQALRRAAELEARRPFPRPEPLTYPAPPPKEPKPWTQITALLMCLLGTLAVAPVFAIIWLLIEVATHQTDDVGNHAAYVWWPFFVICGVLLSWFWFRSAIKAGHRQQRYAKARDEWQQQRAAYGEGIQRQTEMPLPRSTPWHRMVFYLYNRARDSWLCNGDVPISFGDELAARQCWADIVNWHGPPPDLWELCWVEGDEVVSHSRGPLNAHAERVATVHTLPPAPESQHPTTDAHQPTDAPAGERLSYVFIDRTGEVLLSDRFSTKNAVWKAWQSFRAQDPAGAGRWYVSAIDGNDRLIGKPVVLY
jgi:hypothetical protein